MRYSALIVMILLPSICLAAPSITTYSGGVISGSSFGTRSNAPKYFNNYSTTTTGQVPREWASADTTFGGKVATTNPRIAGKNHIKFNYTCTAPSNGTNCEAWSRDYYDLGAGGATEVYLTAWIYLNKSGSTNTRWQWKNTIWGSSVANEGYFTGTANQAAAGCEEWWDDTSGWFNTGMYAYWNGVSNSVSGGSLPSDAYLWDQWQRIEWYGKATTDATGILYLNRIGRSSPMINKTSSQTIGTGNDPWRIIGIGQGLTNVINTYGGNGSVVNLNYYMDQVYVDTTRARVELCDTATWAARTHCEIQPTTAWSATDITTTQNVGSFAANATVYAYVVDSAGVVNANGTEVTLGGGGADTTPPTVTAFAMPATANSLTVAVNSFTATDDTAVTGYLITGTATTPTLDAPWSESAPSTYTFSAQGNNTAYAWARDAAGNVSSASTAVVNIDTIAPVTTANKTAGRYQTSQLVTLSTEGGATTKYCLGAGCTPTTTYTAPFKVLQNVARQHLRFYSTDAASNDESIKQLIFRKQRR